MSSPPLDTPLPVMDSIYGSWLLGSFACVLFQGMIFHQTYRYFKLYPKDAIQLKIWVAVVNVIELVVTLMAVHASYYYMVSHAFELTVLLKRPIWSISYMPIPATLATIFVELFFARRLWLFDHRFRPIVVLAILLNLADFSCFMAMIILSSHEPDAYSFLRYSYLASIGGGLIGISDILVTGCLICVLHTRRTGIKHTDSKLDILIKYAVSTGLIVCIGNLMNVIFSVVYPDNWIYIGIAIAVTKLYANAFLVSLNARHSLMSTDVIFLEQTWTTRWGGPIVGTRISFATPSGSGTSDAPTRTSQADRAQAGHGHTEAGAVFELKQKGTEESDSKIDMTEYNGPRGRDGDVLV